MEHFWSGCQNSLKSRLQRRPWEPRGFARDVLLNKPSQGCCPGRPFKQTFPGVLPRGTFWSTSGLVPKLAQIEPPGVHFGAFLAWMPKPVKSSLLRYILEHFRPGCQNSLKSSLLRYILEHFWPGCQNSLKSNLLGYILEHFWPGCQNSLKSGLLGHILEHFWPGLSKIILALSPTAWANAG